MYKLYIYYSIPSRPQNRHRGCQASAHQVMKASIFFSTSTSSGMSLHGPSQDTLTRFAAICSVTLIIFLSPCPARSQLFSEPLPHRAGRPLVRPQFRQHVALAQGRLQSERTIGHTTCRSSAKSPPAQIRRRYETRIRYDGYRAHNKTPET